MAFPTLPVHVINMALARIGHADRIADVYEGSAMSRTALDLYSQVRDAELRREDWGFAEGQIMLALLKTAPVNGYSPSQPWTTAYPMLPWIYEYAYPTDCLKVRAIRTPPVIIPDYVPRPVTWRIANDNALRPAARVILTNRANAMLVYTRQITDMSTWEPLFTESVVSALGKALGPALATLKQEGVAAEKIEAADEIMDTETAIARTG